MKVTYCKSNRKFVPFPKIVKAEYVYEYKIKITFSDGHVNTFNYASMVNFNHEEFKQYRDLKKFRKFKVVDSLQTIAWGKNWEMILQHETLYSLCRINPKCHFGKPKPERIMVTIYLFPLKLVEFISNGCGLV